jgi:replicative DNA helicase
MVDSVGLDDEEKKNIILCDEQMDAEELYTYGCQLAALHPDLYFIGVDFADLLVSGEEDDAKVGRIYRTMAKLAKVTHVPVMLLSQLNREYVGGIPRITNLRYSGLAEAMGALIFLLYNPGQVWVKQGGDERLPVRDGRAYIIVGKSRFGFREGGVGAIEVNWNGINSWGEEDFSWRDLH